MAKSVRKALVFISWSRLAGLSYAEFVKDILEILFQDEIQVFISTNIGKGKSFWNELRKNLRDARFGIVIVTRDSLMSPWLHFEAGAMLNCEPTPLLFGIAPEELPDTLRNVQATEFNIDDMERVVLHINRRLGTPYRATTLSKQLNELWPVIQCCYDRVRDIAIELAGMPQERTLRELMVDVLDRLDKLQMKAFGSEYKPNWPNHSSAKRTGLPFTISGSTTENPTLSLHDSAGSFIAHVEIGTAAGRKEFTRFMRKEVLKPLREKKNSQ